ncbi:MAG: hypothetical protein AAGF11_33450 [Myxococcota bacterium]
MPSQRATRGAEHVDARVPMVLLWIGLMVGCRADDRPPASGSTGRADSSTGGSQPASTTALDSSGSDPSTGESGSDWELGLEVGDDVGAFFSVWGSQPDRLYAVASQPTGGGLSLGSIQRWDGNAWSAHPVPARIPGLNWVFGVGDRRFVVGELGVILVRDGDEGEWTQYGCETVLPLWGVWAAAVDDAWAVGGDGFNRDPVACHFDGQSWTPWPLPEPSFESHALYKIWGTATDDVWAVGDAGLVMHWGGEAEGWTEVPSGTDFDLISLWGTGPDEILAVGGRATGVLSRWDGRQWTAQQIPELPGLNGVWMASDGTAVVVGPRGGAGVVAPGALVVQLQDSGTGLALHGVYGFASGERWAVGGSLDMAPPYVGVIVHQIP